MATLRVVMKQRLFNEEVRNTFHVVGGDATQTNAQGIIDYFRSMWDTHLKTALTVNWNLYAASAKELDVVSNPTIDYALTAGQLNGTNINNQMPNQTALLVSWLALTARPNRGRTYLAGLTEDVNGSSGQWTGTATTAALAWANGMLAVSTPYPGLGMAVTRVSKPSGVLVGSNLIDSARIAAVPATMRSRRIGTGV